VRVLHLSRNLRYSDLSICLAVDENSTTLTCEQASQPWRALLIGEREFWPA
jgi:hypothetical protein